MSTDPAATAVSVAPVADWTQGLDPDARALVGVKGYKSPNDLAKAYIHAERAIGADKIALPPRDARPEEWSAVWSRLGRPDNADGYGLKAPDGFPAEAYDAGMAKAFADAAHKAGLSTQQVSALHDWYLGSLKGALGESEKTIEDNRLAATAELRREYGAAYDKTIAMAQRALKQFGGDELAQLAEETGLGNDPRLVRAFAKIGAAIGEDNLVGGGGAGFALSPEAAKAEIARIQGEARENPKHALFDRMHPEHDGLIKKMESLFQMAYPS